MSVYPENVGSKIIQSTFSLLQIQSLKQDLPKDTIVRVYGLSGVGKGTLSEKISESLAIPCLNSGLIWRAITYICLDLQIPPTTLDTRIITDNLITNIDLQGLYFFYNQKKLLESDLKNNSIDKEVYKFAQNQILRDLFDDILQDILFTQKKTPIVSDGRGSHEPYLVEAENRKYKVIRILVDCDQEVKTQRYFLQYAKNHPEFDLKNPDSKEKLINEFKQDIVTRDQKDVENIIAKNLGLISEDTGILDNSTLTPQQTLETALAYIERRLQELS